MRRFRRYRSRTSSGRFSWRRGQRRTSLWCGTRGQFFRIFSIDYLRLYEGTKEMLQALREKGEKALPFVQCPENIHRV